MPTVIVEDGTNVAGANAYVDPASAFAVAYFAGQPYSGVAWAAMTPTEKEAFTIFATQTLDNAVEWKGLATNDDQALRWPRIGMVKEMRIFDDDEIPDDIKRATLELASYLKSRDRTNPDAATQETKKISLGKGAVELEFTQGTSSASAVVNVLPDSVWRMIRYYGTPIGTRGSRTARTVK